jgi:putative membrane protein
MKILSTIMVLIVAALHGWFLVVEMFLYEHPIGLKAFSHTPEHAAETAMFAANQGLYNGFLVAGLLWGLLRGKRDFTLFFLLFVIIAGVYAGIVVDPGVFYIQAVPAALALVLTLFAPKSRSA